MVKAMNFGIVVVVSEFELQSRFQIPLGKGMNPIILLAMG